MATVVGLTFLFGFGNVWTLALRLEGSPWVAPLVAPAVDLPVLGLLLGTRFLALHGARPQQLRPARRLLGFSSVITLALNVADPVIAGQVGKAAFDAVGPLLLIGWAEVGPGLLQAIGGIHRGGAAVTGPPVIERCPAEEAPRPAVSSDLDASDSASLSRERNEGYERQCLLEDDLLERARQEDARHWEMYQRPISAESLRKRIRIGAARSRMLVATVRKDSGSDRSCVGNEGAARSRQSSSPLVRASGMKGRSR
jgi:hypothetical protein